MLCNNQSGCDADGTTFDAIAPFVGPGDLAHPNEVYFARVDEMLQLAAKRNCWSCSTSGWLDTLRANGKKKVEDFGVYVGRRYKDFLNIIWLSGNDYQSWQTEKTMPWSSHLLLDSLG